MNEEEQMLSSILKCRRADLRERSKRLSPEQKLKFGQMAERRAKGEPLQYIIGHCEFMGIELNVDPRVFIPRPETELLVDLAIEQLKALDPFDTINILDIGTGSGNIAIALGKFVEDCTVTGVDIDGEALNVAKQNAKKNLAEDVVKFRKRDMIRFLHEARRWETRYDLVISNPPYIVRSQMGQLPLDVQQEPAWALDGGEDGLDFYRKIIREAHLVIKLDGLLMMEIGDDQAEAVAGIFSKHPVYTNISFYKDYVGTKRIVTARVRPKK